MLEIDRNMEVHHFIYDRQTTKPLSQNAQIPKSNLTDYRLYGFGIK